MKLGDAADCTGCLACVNSCGRNALYVVTDCEGFQRPELDGNLCAECGRCEKACHVRNPVTPAVKDQGAYACWTNDRQLRLDSSSGGIFTEIAKVAISNGGVVFGAAYDDGLEVHHDCETTQGGLSRFRGSKYVQSRIGTSYKQAEQFLLAGKTVLFSGTPCQVAGLRGYLGKQYGGLYTLDLVCHGVPSPLIFKQYKAYLEQKLGTKVTDLKFRDKKYSWRYYNIAANERADNAKRYLGTYYSDPYVRGFLRGYFLRPSCHRCMFAGISRVGDITLGDCWSHRGTGAQARECERLGVSLVLANNDKGRTLLDSCRHRLTCRPEQIEDARASNICLTRPVASPPNRESFWADHRLMPFQDLVEKWMRPEKIPFGLYLRSNYRQTTLVKSVVALVEFPSRVANKLFRLCGKRLPRH